MKLLTLGDSFTYGEELTNLSDAWPVILAKQIGYDLTNLAVPGSGNTRMVRSVVENACDYDLIIIAWSHWARIEFADEHGVYDTWPGHIGIKFVNEMSFRHEILEYITKYHSDKYLCNQQVINIILLQQYLKSLDKRFIMLSSFGKFTNVDQNLIDQIDSKNFIGWPKETMMEWTYGCPKGPGGHFLEQGHKQVADKIYEHIRHLSWVS